MTSVTKNPGIGNTENAFFDAALNFAEHFTSRDSIGALLSLVGIFLLIFSGFFLFYLLKKDQTKVSRLDYLSIFIPLAAGLIFICIGTSVSHFIYPASAHVKAEKQEERANKEASRANEEAKRAAKIDAGYNQLKDALQTPLGPAGILKRLEVNQNVDWLIRIIHYDPSNADQRQRLSMNKLTHLGDDDQKYVFVSDYDELGGLTAAKAAERAGLPYKKGDHISVIVFPLVGRRVIYPVNARGILQIIAKIDNPPGAVGAFSIIDRLGKPTYETLLDEDLPTWAFAHYQEHYGQFCREAYNFICDRTNSTAKKLIGDVRRDWHPLGFAQPANRIKRERDPCSHNQIREQHCSISKWPSESDLLPNSVGSRIFMTENSRIEDLRGRILIDFDNPETQKVPLLLFDRSHNEIVYQ